MNRIKELRVKNALTQVELAKKLNIAQNTLSYWESGKTEPNGEALAKLSAIFDVSIDYLLGQTDQRVAGIKMEIKIDENTTIDKAIGDLRYTLNDAIQKGYINESQGEAYLALTKQQLQLIIGKNQNN